MPTRIEIIQDNIINIEVDAIVNTANKTLLGGGGIDGTIHYCAGPDLLEECKKLNGCEKGEAKLTKGYNLPAKYIIHTVGPVFKHEKGLEENILKNCYINSLDLARKNKLNSLAFPAISTGCYRYPKDEAAKIAVDTVREYINKYPETFKKIIFVLFSEFDYLVYKNYLKK